MGLPLVLSQCKLYINKPMIVWSFLMFSFLNCFAKERSFIILSPFCCSYLLHSHYSALCVHCHTPGRGTRLHPFSHPRPSTWQPHPWHADTPVTQKSCSSVSRTQTRLPALPSPWLRPGQELAPIATAGGTALGPRSPVRPSGRGARCSSAGPL